MDGVGYSCAVVLAGVFSWAAAAKLARPGQTAAGMRAMRVPAPDFAARGIPLGEAMLAVALLVAPRLGGVMALSALLGFSLAVALALWAGVTTGCSCFGAASTEPVSGHDLVRNALLAVLAVAAWWAPEPTVPAAGEAALVAALVTGGVVALRVSSRRRTSPGRRR